MKEDLEIHWEDYYKVLRIDPDASQEEIKEAYKDNAFIFHSDRLAGAPESARRRAEEELKKVNLAYYVFRDPKKRQRYCLEQTYKKRGKVKRASVNEMYCPECGKAINIEYIHLNRQKIHRRSRQFLKRQ
ncbi:MAG: J domain-containing protein [Candidatus Humimicrobiaceae bacterium]